METAQERIHKCIEENYITITNIDRKIITYNNFIELCKIAVKVNTLSFHEIYKINDIKKEDMIKYWFQGWNNKQSP